jgi:hypothetical protein
MLRTTYHPQAVITQITNSYNDVKYVRTDWKIKKWLVFWQRQIAEFSRGKVLTA